MVRIVGRFLDQRQVGHLVDSLRNIGFDRKDMIISNLADEQRKSAEEVIKEQILITSERDSIRLGETLSFGKGIKELKGKEGTIVAVEAPKRESDRIRSIMLQSGAVEIIQD